jgi:superfamily II DNA or RNA helicase
MSSPPNYNWQQVAIRAWRDAKYRGIVEAVTGSGKTHVAIDGLADLTASDRLLSTLIVVPTIPLLGQWYEKLTQRFPGKRIGRIGGDYRDQFAVFPLAYVATIHSALRYVPKLFSHCWEGPNAAMYRSFLIADECHHYVDSEVWSNIITKYQWNYTLGLSATIQNFGIDGFGKIVCTYTFKDAFRDGLVPPFDLLNVSVPLTASEEAQYFDLSTQIGKQFSLVMDMYEGNLDGVPDDWLFKRLQQLMGKIGSRKEPEIEKLFLMLFKRAAIYYMAQQKLDLATTMTRMLVDSGKKVIVFFERIAAADLVNENIALAAGVKVRDAIKSHSKMWVKTFHSAMPQDERDRTLAEFRSRGPSALIVCRSLDEGLDIPEVDGAVLVASTKSLRQRIQRIGRTLRRGDGTKRPTIITLFARGTGDSDVTNEDKKQFEGVADIAYANEETGIPKLWDILGGRSGSGNKAMATVTLPEQWKVVGDADEDEVIPEQAIPVLMKHIGVGDNVRLVLADGQTIEGKYSHCTSHTVFVVGSTCSTDRIRRILVKKD